MFEFIVTLASTTLASLLIFFLPGFFISRLFFRSKLVTAEHFFLAIPLSVCFSAVFTNIVFARLSLPFTQSTVLLTFLAVAVVGYILTHKQLLHEGFRISSLNRERLTPYWPLFIAVASFILIRQLNYLIYPPIPEADGYPLIRKISKALSDGTISQFIYRPFFPQLFTVFASATGLDPTALFRHIVPLLLTPIAAIPVLITSRLKLSSFHQLVAGLVVLSVPAIAAETDYIRAQTPVILVSFTVIWLLFLFRQTKDWFFWITALGIAGLSYAFHEFSLFAIIACFAILLPWYIGQLKKNLKQTLLLTVGCIIVLLPYLQPILTVGVIPRIISGVSNLFSNPYFELWFIDSYVNIDGNNLGWPGLSAALYYGYNVGMAVPLILILGFKVFSKTSQSLKSASLAFLVAPLLFAEIFPRFGITFLPDRAWLYLSISLVFLAVAYLPQTIKRWQKVLLLTALCLSILVSLALTHLKQGWITTEELTAARWIATNTPTNSYLYTQVGSIDPLAVYTKRQTLNANQIFADSRYTSPIENFQIKQTKLTTDLNSATQALQTATETPEVSVDQVKSLQSNYLQVRKNLTDFIEKESIDPNAPVYIVYSSSKFDSLYGKRGWWKQINNHDADLSFLQDSSLFEVVYQVNGTIVWRVR